MLVIQADAEVLSYWRSMREISNAVIGAIIEAIAIKVALESIE